MYNYSLYDSSLLILDDDGGSSNTVFVLEVLVAVVQKLGDALTLVLLDIEVGLWVVITLVVVAVDTSDSGFGVIFIVVMESSACSVVDCWNCCW